jgi:hypothetical protein
MRAIEANNQHAILFCLCFGILLRETLHKSMKEAQPHKKRLKTGVLCCYPIRSRRHSENYGGKHMHEQKHVATD